MTKIKSKRRGGPRKGAGRPPKGTKPVQYSLSEVAIRRIEELARSQKKTKSAVVDRIIRKAQF